VKLGTRKDGTRDGALVVVRRDLKRCASAAGVARTLQEALDRWDEVEPALRELQRALEADPEHGDVLEPAELRSPLPRAYEWIDGSAFINHVVLVRKARGAEPPPTLWTDPLVYQGGSGDLLDPTQDIPLRDVRWGLDFEGEVVVVLGDTPLGTTAADAHRYVRLIGIVNDNTLRNLIPDELAKGFGFFQSKPASAFSPVFVTPDELGDAWRDGRLHLPLLVWHNDAQVGKANAGPEMHFSFFDLIQHICRTRAYTAGTILGSGTISNADPETGYSCIAEIRMREILADGAPRSPFLVPGDTVRIEMRDADGANLFGTIHQRVVSAP
jgi:fumarylacetoacetate (FAA) hydrolase